MKTAPASGRGATRSPRWRRSATEPPRRLDDGLPSPRRRSRAPTVSSRLIPDAKPRTPAGERARCRSGTGTRLESGSPGVVSRDRLSSTLASSDGSGRERTGRVHRPSLGGDEPCRDARLHVGLQPGDAAGTTRVTSPSRRCPRRATPAQRPAATAIPEADEEPPGSWSRFHGFRAGRTESTAPEGELRQVQLEQNAAAASSREITVASPAAT